MNGVQNTYGSVSGDRLCACPYTCITTNECAARHATRGTEQVLFRCGEKGKICCPPKNSKPKPFRRREVNNRRYEDNCPDELDSFPTTPTENNLKKFKGNNNATTQETNYFLVPSGIYVHTDDNLKNQKKPTLPPETSAPGRPPSAQVSSFRPQPLLQPISLKKKPPKISLTSHRNFKLLPSESHCGVNNFANRITEGEEVSLGEYPWMALTGVKGNINLIIIIIAIVVFCFFILIITIIIIIIIIKTICRKQIFVVCFFLIPVCHNLI